MKLGCLLVADPTLACLNRMFQHLLCLSPPPRLLPCRTSSLMLSGAKAQVVENARFPLNAFCSPPPIEHLSSFKVHLGSGMGYLVHRRYGIPVTFRYLARDGIDAAYPIPAITSGLAVIPLATRVIILTGRKRGFLGHVSGANADDRFKADLQAQTAPTFSRDLGNDLASLVKDLNSGK